MIVDAMLISDHLGFKLYGRFWLRKCAFNNVVMRSMRCYKFLYNVCSGTLTLEKRLCVVNIVEKDLTVWLWPFLNVSVRLRFTVTHVVHLFKCSINFWWSYILVVFLQDKSFFTRKIPILRLSISQYNCVRDRKFKYRISWRIFCPQAVDQPF